jgi:hypothetical protein
VACLTVSILAGFVPLLVTGSQVQAHPGDLLTPWPDRFNPGEIKGSLKCQINGDSKQAPFIILAPGQIGKPLGRVDFDSLKLFFAIDSFDLDPVQKINRITIKGSIVSPEKADDFVKSCLGSSNAKLALSGFVVNECVYFQQAVHIIPKVEISVNGTLKLSGNYDGIANCGRIIAGNPNSGNCITGTDKNENLIGSSQNDCINGKGGNDKISGLAGNDKLNGGDGKDLLGGGNGNDELTGGKGADKFDCGAGNDKITDFKPSEGDIKSTNCE